MFEQYEGEATEKAPDCPRLGSAAIGRDQRGRVPLSDLLDGFRVWMREQPPAISSGIPGLDRLLGGGWRGGLISLGASPGDGKTALAVQFAVNAAKSGRRVIYLSYELSWQTVVQRMLVCIAGKYSPVDRRFTMADLRGIGSLPEAKATGLTMALAELEAIAPMIYVFDGSENWPGGMGARGIADFIAERADGGTVGVVDYLQAVPLDDENGDTLHALESACAILRDMARHNDVPLLLLSSLAKTDTLKGSSNIAHDSTVIMRLRYTEASDKASDKANIKALQVEKMRNPRHMSLFIEKCRDGEPGIVPLMYWPQWGRFAEVAGFEKGNQNAE